MGLNSSKQKSSPVDMTPAAFENLQSPFANTLAGLLGFSQQQPAAAPAPSGVTGGMNAATQARMMESPQQRYSRQQREKAGSGHVDNISLGGPSTQSAAQAPTFASSGDPLSGIPKYGGPLVAGLGANEQAILDQLMGLGGVGGQSTTSNSQNFLNDAIAGKYVPAGETPESINDYVNRLNLGYTPETSLGGFADELAGASNTGAYGGDNPFLQAAIQAAQRPTLQGLEETLSRTLPGRFTQAGQFNQPGGSSAFDRAAAIATRGAADANADIATNISYASYEASRGREAEALASELERRGQFAEAARTREAAAKESAATRYEGARDRQQEAALAKPGVQKQEIDNAIANLQAQALPRLIQDLGIERGIEQFNNQVNSLMQTLGITAGVTRPVTSQQSSGSSTGISLK